jgi:hypothetical protein|tara:strand:- start:588 stop:1091 length:504 start_codon:yes stop_codon:yes gene_type:complete
MNINQKLTKIQTKFKAKKSRYNKFGDYKYRSAEDILEAIKPFLDELKLYVTIHETILAAEGDFPIIESKATISDGENSIHATAIVGVDINQKGMAMPQRFGTASSYAKKYSLGNLLLIDDTQDDDAGNKPELKGEALEKAKKFLADGGKLEAIKSKYKIPAATLKTL